MCILGRQDAYGLDDNVKKKIAEKKKAMAMMNDGEPDEKMKKVMEKKAAVSFLHPSNKNVASSHCSWQQSDMWVLKSHYLAFICSSWQHAEWSMALLRG